MDDRKRRKPGWLFWATAILVTGLILYLLSIGPMIYIYHATGQSRTPAWEVVIAAYAPIRYLRHNAPSALRFPPDWYIQWWLQLSRK